MAEQPLLVLEKITRILDVFTLTSPTRTVAEIRDATGLPTSTAHRLVANLVEHGFLDRSGDVYRIGARMAFWAGPAARARDSIELLSPQLKALRDSTGETACFFRAEDLSRVCIAVAETRHGLRREMYVGKIQPLHVGSAGRVILAWRPDLLEQVLARPLEAMTDATITDPDVLRHVVHETQARGYAITEGERLEAASGLAAPVFDEHSSLVGALTVLGPTLRLDAARCEELVDEVMLAADGLTAAFGGRRPA